MTIDHYTPPEAAARLRRSVQTLANWRVRGYGPPWRKDPGANGRVLYPVAGVDAWLAAGVRRSTAETLVDTDPMGVYR